MSIKEAAYNFQKKIWESPNREEVKNVVGKLKSGARGLGNKIFPTPMLGLLLYNQQAIKRYLGKSAVEELTLWSERDLNILYGIHNQILNLNRSCLAPLVSKLPDALNAVNPYKEYEQVASSAGSQDLLFRAEESYEVIASFHTHPGFEIALSTLSSVKEGRLDYDKMILEFNSEIVEAGPGGTPQWIFDYENAARWDRPEAGIFHHLGALLSLRDSLANLDQLIYQGLFQEEFVRLDRRQIIDYLWTAAGAGPSLWVMHIPFGYMYLIEVTDLITVNVDGPDRINGRGDTLCVLHSQNTPLSQTSPGILKMRILDDHLNSYRNLL